VILPGKDPAPIRRTGDESRKAIDSAPSCGNDCRMPFPWQPQEYARTCVECGYTWQVPRWARRWRFRSLRMLSTMQVTAVTGESSDSTDLGRQVDSISAQNQWIEAFRYCPKCRADHFTQRASRGKQPG
jgi:hypothetical protein